jgi:hypothetical protein
MKNEETRSTLVTLSVVLLFLTTGCATSFTPWQGRQVYQGGGGTVRQSNGIDIWENGEPDRPYIILGVIDSSTVPSSSILVGAVFSAASAGDMVNVAKKNGGDAIILVSEQATSGGYTGMVNPTYGGGANVTLRERVGRNAKVVVVKYVTDRY